jgi:hypothetical protein
MDTNMNNLPKGHVMTLESFKKVTGRGYEGTE